MRAQQKWEHEHIQRIDDKIALDKAAYEMWRGESGSKARVARLLTEAGLTEIERLIVVRHFYQSQSTREIAETFTTERMVYPGMHGGTWNHETVRRIYHRAIRKLRLTMEKP